MRYRDLSDRFKVSAVGLGCMDFSHAYGAAMDEVESVRLIRAAHDDFGYTLFDTAETYGTAADPHANERLVGKALAPVRDDVTIVTKFGIHFDYENDKPPYPLHLDSSPETIRRSVEGSLERLGTDHIDLYLQHRIDPTVEPEVVAETVGELIGEGKVLRWGISEATDEYLRRANAVTPVGAIQNRYSMMARWHEPLFATCEELDVGWMAFSPLANGLLTGGITKANNRFDGAAGDYRAGMPQFTDEALDKNQALIDLVAGYAKAHDATDAQISLAWMLCKKPYIVPIPGARRMERIAQNAQASEVDLSIEEVAAIDRALDELESTGALSAVFGGHAGATVDHSSEEK